MARPNKGANHVVEIQGNRESKRRAKIILQTITGELSVKEACRLLGVGPTQFANLRTQGLKGLVDSMDPKPVGRPTETESVSPTDPVEQKRLVDLERENRLLRAQVEVAALRREAASRSKSRGKAAPRSDTTGGAVP